MTTNQISDGAPAAPQRAAHPTTVALGATTSRARVRPLLRETGLVLAGAAALVLIGQIALPLPFTPVPLTLGTLAALGVGGLLGSRRGAASALLLAGLAALGAPVLAGWSGGVTASFGYVLGYALVAAVAGRATARHEGRGRGLLARTLLMLAASAVVYVPGVLWLSVATGMGLSAAVGAGVLPFLVGDVLKSLAAAGVLRRRAI